MISLCMRHHIVVQKLYHYHTVLLASVCLAYGNEFLAIASTITIATKYKPAAANSHVTCTSVAPVIIIAVLFFVDHDGFAYQYILISPLRLQIHQRLHAHIIMA